MVSKSNLSILVVEDNPGDYTLVEDFLLEQVKGVTVTLARDFKEAKKHLSVPGRDFNIVLLDLSLPDKTGEDLVKEIIQLSNPTPVIVLTGYADFDFGVKSISQGVSDYILKDELTALTLYKTILYSLERKKITSSLEESEKRVRSFARQLNQIVEEERARIAREIHDEFGQQLSGIKMSLSLLRGNKIQRTNVDSVVDTIVEEVNHSIQSLRKISNELRPVLLDKLGLFAAIEWLIKEFEKKTGIESHFTTPSLQPKILKETEINIFRICQEALTNIGKHAKSTQVKVEIVNEKSFLKFKISDNGKGINSGTLHDPLSSGLLNMRERANLINAPLNITSSYNQGTNIEFTVSINGTENFNC